MDTKLWACGQITGVPDLHFPCGERLRRYESPPEEQNRYLPSAPSFSPVSPNRSVNQRFFAIFHFIIKAYHPTTPILLCQETRHDRPWRKLSLRADRDPCTRDSWVHDPGLVKETGAPANQDCPQSRANDPELPQKNLFRQGSMA